MTAILIVNGNTLSFAGKTYPCAVGRGGIIAASKKKEGDGCTPAGEWKLRECWYRADRLSAPKTALPLCIITKNDGWCDDAGHPQYNRHVTLPFAAHHENLWLDDGTYDLIVPLGYNDDPVIPGKGSAIFLHVAKPDFSPTAGCVALAKEDLLEMLKVVNSDSQIVIGV